MADEDGPDLGLVLDQIKSGEFDGKLVDLIEVIRLRFDHGTTKQRWKITHPAGEFTEDDLTMGEGRLIERMCGTSWGLLNPVSSATECTAIIAACLHKRNGMSLKFTRDGPEGEAWDAANALNLKETVDSISSYEVEAAPKD